jgi:hypothetical protein
MIVHEIIGFQRHFDEACLSADREKSRQEKSLVAPFFTL